MIMYDVHAHVARSSFLHERRSIMTMIDCDVALPSFCLCFRSLRLQKSSPHFRRPSVNAALKEKCRLYLSTRRHACIGV